MVRALVTTRLRVSYCSPSSMFGGKTWGSGSIAFDTNDEFNQWLEKELAAGPVLITHIERS